MFRHLVTLAAALVAQKSSIAGDYTGIQIDGRPIPVYDRLPSAPGTVRSVSVQSFAATLTPDGRFRAMVRYTNEANAVGMRPKYAPVLDASIAGRYTVSGAIATFVPTRKPNAKREVFAGTISGKRIAIPFDYLSGTMRRRVVVVLERTRDW
jgi:hypothetical protein